MLIKVVDSSKIYYQHIVSWCWIKWRYSRFQLISLRVTRYVVTDLRNLKQTLIVMGLAYNVTIFTQNFVKIDKIIRKLKLGNTNTQYGDLINLLSFLKRTIKHGPYRKRRLQQFFVAVGTCLLSRWISTILGYKREREKVGGSERHYIWGGGKKLFLRFWRFPGSARLSFLYR
jgi:hypothetical protein